MAKLTKKLKDKLTEIACKQFRQSFEFKKDRMEEIRRNEEFYNLRDIKVPRGRFAVPLPVMSGFVDTLVSKIDEPPQSKFISQEIADKKKMDMITMAFEKDTSPLRGNYAQKDRWSKKLAAFSGRGILKLTFDSNPYNANFSVVDYEDFYTEPLGGGNLNDHMFCGQDGIIKTKYQLENDDSYDKKQVKKIVESTSKKSKDDNSSFYNQKLKRYRNLGLNIETNTYVGQNVYKFIEWVTDYQGEKYYLLFNLESEKWIRVENLKSITKSNMIPWASWATHEDSNIFWSKAPCDDMRPIADVAETLLNQELYNRAKNNMGQRAFDSEIFPDPSQLAWRPDGLVEGNPGPRKRLGDGIYEFKTREFKTTIDLLQFLDAYGARKTGVNPGMSQVPEKDQRVGIRFANMQDMADRLGLFNKSYQKAQDEIAHRYYHGVIENLSEKELIEMIGNEAYRWNEIKNRGSKQFDIELTSRSAEIEANAEKEQKRAEALAMIMKDPQLSQAVNPQWRIRETLKLGGYDEMHIKAALSDSSMADQEVVAEAALAVQDILRDKKPKRVVRTANIEFLQYLLDFANDMDFDEKSTKTKDVESKKHYTEIMKYLDRHIPVVKDNLARKAASVMARRGDAIRESVEGDASPRKPRKPTMQISENVTVAEPQAGQGMPIKKGVEATNILKGNSESPI